MAMAEILCAAIMLVGTPRADVACRHMDTVVEAAEANNVDPYVMLGLIHVESRWLATARSSSNACGLTQILPRYTGSKKTGVPKLTCEQLFDPTTSIVMGARTFSFWLRSYARGNYKTALCGYNKGYRCKGDSPHPTGVRYANRVMWEAEKIKRAVAKIKKEG